MNKKTKRLQLTLLVPSHNGDHVLTGMRAFDCPKNYKDTKLLAEALKAVGTAIEAIDKEHIS